MERSIKCLFLFGVLASGSADTTSIDILDELAGILGPKEMKAIEVRAPPMEEALRTIFATMPHNEHGNADQSVVRYILHRLFMQRGWSVRGLEPAGQGWSTGSPTQMLGTVLPRPAVEVFESKLQTKGLGLHDTAVLAATFKGVVVRSEMVDRLQAAYRHHDHEISDVLSEDVLWEVIDTFTASFVVGTNISNMELWEVYQMENRARQEYNNLPKVIELARQAKYKIIGAGDSRFEDVVEVVEDMADRFGPSEDGFECQPRRDDLLSMEKKGSGRVPLSVFYRAALGGKWHFGESEGYLRQLGALDESNPGDLQIIIPNYINSKSNCVDPSKYYSVCCINECDALLGRLETDVGSPSATAAEIAEKVATIPSSSLPGGPKMTQQLEKRLEDVAEGNGGRVPLHGRLFAQWMHHAFPRECPFPHLAGTTSPLRVEDWAAENEVVASKEEMKQHAEKEHSEEGDDDEGECAPWMQEEELLTPHASSRRRMPAGVFWWVASILAILAAIASGALQMSAAPGRMQTGTNPQKMADLSMVSFV